MRSNVLALHGGGGSGDRSPASQVEEDEETGAAKQLRYCCWWRSAREFDRGGHPNPELYPAKAGGLSSLSPRAKVLKEMERLAVVSHESLDDLRHKLLSYRSGDLWVPTGGVAKEETDVPPVITFLLVGFAGAGKSSLVNLMYSVLGHSGLVPFADTSSSNTAKGGKTRRLEEHNVLRSTRSGFCVFDSKGLDYERVDEGLEDVAEWMHYGVRHRQVWGGGDSSENGLGSVATSTRFVRRKVNCALVVANLLEIYKSYRDGNLRPLEATRDLFHSPSLRICDESPILVLTHGDKLSTDERIEGRLTVCEFLGISETTGAYDIACLNEHGLLVDEFDPVTAYTLAEIVYRGLLLSDRNHQPKKSHKDRVWAVLSWVMWCLSAFFAFLSYCFSKLAKRDWKHKWL